MYFHQKHKNRYLSEVDTKKLELAVSDLKEGRHEKALSAFNKLIDEFKNDPDLFAYRGATLLNLNRKHAALDDFNRAVDLDPDYSYRYASRAFAKDALGDLAGAIADYEIAIKLDPDDAIAHNNLGLLIEKSGNQTHAQRHFAQADNLAKRIFGETGDQESSEATSGIPLQPKKLTPDPSSVNSTMYWEQLTRIFKSKEERKAFVSFILSGFQKKKDD